MKLFLLIIPLLFLTSKAFCSFKPAEGLLIELDTASGTHRINILNELAEMYLANSISKSIDFSTKAFQEGLRINYTLGWCRGLITLSSSTDYLGIAPKTNKPIIDFIKLIIKMENDKYTSNFLKMQLGIFMAENANYIPSINYLIEALDYFKSQDDYANIAETHKQLGRFYLYIQDYTQSGENFEQSVKYNLLCNDTIQMIWNSLYAAVSYNSAKEYNRADNINKKAFELSKMKNFKLGIANYHRVEGLINLDAGDINHAIIHFDSAIVIYEENSFLISLADMYTLKAHSLNLLGEKNANLENNILAYLARTKLGSARYIASSMINVGYAYLDFGNYSDAYNYAIRGAELSKIINYLNYSARAYLLLSKIAKSTGNYKSSLNYLEAYNSYISRVNDNEKMPEIIKSQLKYELEKKDKDLIAMKLQDEINKNFFISIIVILVVVILIFLIIRIIQKQKHNRMLIKKNVMLESAYKELTEKEKDLQLLNSELDNLVKIRTQHLDAEIHRRGMAEENLIQLKDNLQIAYEKEKELNSLKTRFISMISHEFRTPMTIITSSVDIINMMEDNENSQKILKQSNKIKNSIKQMTSLIDEVIAFSRSEENAMNLNIEEFNLYSLSHEIIDEQKIVYKSKINISLISNFQPCYIHSDKRILRHILSNLIGNAIKYTPDDKSINIQIDQKQNLIHYTIEDRGIGIPSCDIDNIWDPFFRGHNIKSISGTGFGLYIVKEFVHRINGDIKITSNINIGTKVSLILSIKQ